MAQYSITYEEAGQKCLAFLQRKYKASASFIHKLLRKGSIRLNGKRCKPNVVLSGGDILYLPASLLAMEDDGRECDKNLKREHDITKDIHYEDDSLLVLNKPAGMPVHNGTRHKVSIMSLVQEQYKGASFTPTLVHRLDKDTTGILLLAKTYTQLQACHSAWRSGEVHKYYLAWVKGIWKEERSKRIENNIHKGEEKSIVTEGNDVAITVKCLCRKKASSLLVIQLHTGKTHQIRAQLAHYGFPIIGDGRYTSNSKKFPLLLHAVALFISEKLHYVVLPHHWYGNFAVKQALPVFAKEFSGLFCDDFAKK